MGSKRRVVYDVEFRRQLVDLARKGERSVPQLAKDFGCSDKSIYKWLRQADIDAGRKEGLTTEERSELSHLRKENAILREERDILKKAAAWFAQESASTPKRRTNS